MSMKAVKIIDAFCIVLFVFMGIYIFALPDASQDSLMPVFNMINPYKTGAWIIGVGFLITCIWGKGRTGLILGIVLLACYLITAFVSLVGLIVITSGVDLLWYLHPILIVIGCIVAIRRKTSMINKERAKVGAEPLVLDEALNETALIKAKDMAEYDAFSHESERLGNLTDQLKSIGYEYSCCGENIAMNQTTVSWVMNAWMNSDGHRENILNKLQNNRYRAL